MSGHQGFEADYSGGAEERVRRAVEAVAAGRPVVVGDDADRENEGDLILAAEHATAELLAFVVRHTSGFVCVAMPEADCERLALPPMARSNRDRFSTAYRVTVDAVGCGTGISARDRACTIARLASKTAAATDFTRPGHVVPLAARAGGVLERRGHTEAAVDLAVLAGCRPVGALCEIVSRERPGAMARGEELRRFANEYGLAFVNIADLVTVRCRLSPVRRGPTVILPTEFGEFRAVSYASVHDGAEHLALTRGPVDGAGPVYVHVECLAGDGLHPHGCRCRRDLYEALSTVARQGSGVVVYLRPTRAMPSRVPAGRTLHERAAEQMTGILVDLGLESMVPASGSWAPGWLSAGPQPPGRSLSSMWTRTADPSDVSQPFLSA